MGIESELTMLWPEGKLNPTCVQEKDMDPTLESNKPSPDQINVACIIHVAFRRLFRTLSNIYDRALLRLLFF